MLKVGISLFAMFCHILGIVIDGLRFQPTRVTACLGQKFVTGYESPQISEA